MQSFMDESQRRWNLSETCRISRIWEMKSEEERSRGYRRRNRVSVSVGNREPSTILELGRDGT